MVIVVGPKVPNPRRGTQTWCLHWQRLGARPWPQERIVRLRVQVASQTAPALSSRVAEFVCSSQGSIRENWNAVSGTRPESIRLDTDSTAIIRNFELDWPKFGFWILHSCRYNNMWAAGTCRYTKLQDPRTRRTEFRGSVGRTPAISESRFGWRGN